MGGGRNPQEAGGGKWEICGSQPTKSVKRVSVGGGGGDADMLNQFVRTNPHTDRVNTISTPSKSYEALGDKVTNGM